MQSGNYLEKQDIIFYQSSHLQRKNCLFHQGNIRYFSGGSTWSVQINRIHRLNLSERNTGIFYGVPAGYE